MSSARVACEKFRVTTPLISSRDHGYLMVIDDHSLNFDRTKKCLALSDHVEMTLKIVSIPSTVYHLVIKLFSLSSSSAGQPSDDMNNTYDQPL